MQLPENYFIAIDLNEPISVSVSPDGDRPRERQTIRALPARFVGRQDELEKDPELLRSVDFELVSTYRHLQALELQDVFTSNLKTVTWDRWAIVCFWRWLGIDFEHYSQHSAIKPHPWKVISDLLALIDVQPTTSAVRSAIQQRTVN